MKRLNSMGVTCAAAVLAAMTILFASGCGGYGGGHGNGVMYNPPPMPTPMPTRTAIP